MNVNMSFPVDAVRVILEPGDATHYDFIFWREKDCVSVAVFFPHTACFRASVLDIMGIPASPEAYDHYEVHGVGLLLGNKHSAAIILLSITWLLSSPGDTSGAVRYAMGVREEPI